MSETGRIDSGSKIARSKQKGRCPRAHARTAARTILWRTSGRKPSPLGPSTIVTARRAPIKGPHRMRLYAPQAGAVPGECRAFSIRPQGLCRGLPGGEERRRVPRHRLSGPRRTPLSRRCRATEGVRPGDVPPDGQGMDILCALVGVYRFEV